MSLERFQSQGYKLEDGMARRKAEKLCKASLVIMETRKKHKVTVEAFTKSLEMSVI